MATATKVIDLEECRKQYNHVAGKHSQIRFCTDGESSLDVYGHPRDIRRANTNNTQASILSFFKNNSVLREI